MKAPLLLLVLFVSVINVSANQYVTPGTGVKYTLDDLVANAAGQITFSGGEYFVNDTISVNTNDTLVIYNDVTVKFMTNTFIGVRENGVLLIDPPNNVTFTANNITNGYLGVKLDTTNGSIIRKLTFEYAVSFRINDCSPKFDSCTFRYNNNLASTTFGNGAMALFRSSPLITNCSFIQNKRAAIQGGANISNAPKIYNSRFVANSTNNVNVPQINLGSTSASGQDTTKIIGNYIYGGSLMSGGIGFLPTGNVYAIINGNVIRKNRYGIVMQGGSNINSVISYNIIDTNNIENNPNAGGSGISFYGGTATSHQNSIVTGNIIRANLWGITIVPGSRPKPNLGDLSNADTTDDGKNQFINNTNATTPNIDLYNNTPDNIMAENNYWNTNDISVAEQRIFHQVDNASLGLVDFDPIATAESLPVTLLNFEASLQDKKVFLQWKTATEENAALFNIQRSIDGKTFVTVGKEYAAGNTTTVTNYSFNDYLNEVNANTFYYRLEMLDKDGRKSYSVTRQVSVANGIRFTLAPNPAAHHISVQGEGKINMRITNQAGQVVMNRNLSLPATNIDVSAFTKGMYVVTFADSNGIVSSTKLVIQ